MHEDMLQTPVCLKWFDFSDWYRFVYPWFVFFQVPLRWSALACCVYAPFCLFLNSLRWRHNGCDSVSNHQPHHCLLNRLFRRRTKKTSKLRVTGLCAGNSPVTGEFPTQMASNAENVSIWWRHHIHVLLLHHDFVIGLATCWYGVLCR